MIISLFLTFVAFSAFPESKDSIFAHQEKGSIDIAVSGSLGLYHGGKCHPTYGNYTLVSEEYNDWCSNMAVDKKDPTKSPFIQYSLKGKQMKVKKYSVRNGCCRYDCCCTEDGQTIDYFCCCRLYSYSLQASNDNKTWKVLHKVEKDRSFNYCEVKTFEIKEPEAPYTFFRFVLDEEWPSCPKCMQINQIELYGATVAGSFSSINGNEDEDESISIIGRVRKPDQ